jgi:hypothetical protein
MRMVFQFIRINLVVEQAALSKLQAVYAANTASDSLSRTFHTGVLAARATKCVRAVALTLRAKARRRSGITQPRRWWQPVGHDNTLDDRR